MRIDFARRIGIADLLQAKVMRKAEQQQNLSLKNNTGGSCLSRRYRD